MDRDILNKIKSTLAGYIILVCITEAVIREINEASKGKILVLLIVALFVLLYSIFGTAELIRYYKGNGRMRKKDMESSEPEYHSEDEAQQYEAALFTFEDGENSMQFTVPPDYTWRKKEKPKVYDSGMVIFPRFTREDGAIVDCRLYFEPEGDAAYGVTAAEAAQEELGYMDAVVRKYMKIRQTVVDGNRVVYYFITQEKSGFDKMQRLYAVCDVDKGKYFEAEMWNMGWEPVLKIDELTKFFHFS